MNNSSSSDLLEPQKLQPVLDLSKSQISKNRKKYEGNSTESITIAVGYLSNIIEELKNKNNGRPASRKAILDEMKRIGFDISTATLWRYRGKIEKIRSAVRDLLEEGTYSAYFEHNMELLDYIEEQAIEYLNTRWTNSKTEKFVTTTEAKEALEEGRVPKGVLVKVINTGEIASAKHGFLNILTKVVDLRTRATNEDNLDLSCSMLSEEFQIVKDRAEEFERKFIESNKELKSLLRKKHVKSKTSND